MLKVDHVWLILRDYHFLIWGRRKKAPSSRYARDDGAFNLIEEYVPILLLLDAKN